MNRHLCFLLLVLKVSFAFGQQASIAGSVADTVNYKPMAYSGVSLIRISDSILVAHQWIGNQPNFTFSQLDSGNYLLRITRPTYADYEERIVLALNERKDIGNIALISKANLLKEVIIQERKNAITIKGDTTEFFVDSFLVNQNSNVEDLLKRLPGIQVDKNGKITAQGQEVKKVLVDGEEFFGEDPTIATRNIKAENVEAVQVFDKKSDQAAFSGVDDGEKNKTINLKLKEDAKKGSFGKASAGVGTQDRYEYDAMVNRFNNKQKVSAYAAGSNTNKTGLNWEDNQQYGSNDNTFVDEESGSVYTYYNGGGESFDGVGIPQTFYAGAVYTDKFKTDTHSVNANMTYKDLTVSGYNNNYTKYILPDTLYFNNQLNQFNSNKQFISGSGRYEWKLDSLTTLKFDLSLKQLNSDNSSEYTTENLNENNLKVNENKRIQTNTNTDNTYNLGFYLGRKFKTKGRSLSVDLDQSFFDGQSNGFLRSETNFFEGNGTLAKQNSIDQKKVLSSKVSTFVAGITYTEPLNTKWSLVLDGNSKINVNLSDRTSLEQDNQGNYTQVVDSLSNSLRYDIYVNRGGLAFKYNTKKIMYSLGGKTSYTDLRQKDTETGKVQQQYFFNIFPAASFQYKMRASASLSLNYSGRTSQPTLQQIQPIIDNNNPLDLTVGNPNLEQSFANSFSLTYNNYKAVTGSSLYMNVRYWFAQNDFTRYDLVDDFGRRIHQTVNVDGNKRFSFYSYYWFKIGPEGLSCNVNIDAGYSENNNFINGMKNTNYNSNAGLSTGLYYEIEEKLDVGAYANWDFNRTRTSLRTDEITQYWVQTYSVYGSYKFMKKYKLGSDCDFNFRQQTEAFSQNYNTIIWNASLSRTFLKSDNLLLKVSCTDLLNQNIGFRRDATSNYVNENTYTVLKRYFMFSVTWNFTQGGAGGE